MGDGGDDDDDDDDDEQGADADGNDDDDDEGGAGVVDEDDEDDEDDDDDDDGADKVPVAVNPLQWSISTRQRICHTRMPSDRWPIGFCSSTRPSAQLLTKRK